MTTKRGIFKDPWRSAPPVEAEPKKEEAPGPSGGAEDIETSPRLMTIIVPNYGGITVHHVNTGSEVGQRLLEFCVKNHTKVEPFLLQFGIVVVRLSSVPSNTLFYIRRSDGWTVAVPDVKNREQGLVQLVQGFLALAANPPTNKLLKEAGIHPYGV